MTLSKCERPNRRLKTEEIKPGARDWTIGMWGVSVLSSGSHLGRRATEGSPHISKNFFPAALRRIWEPLAGAVKTNLGCIDLVTFSDPHRCLALELNQPALREVKVVTRSLVRKGNLSVLVPERRGCKGERNKGQENGKRLHGCGVSNGVGKPNSYCSRREARDHAAKLDAFSEPFSFFQTPCPRPG